MNTNQKSMNHQSMRRTILRTFAVGTALLGLAAMLGAEDAKRISADEAMASVVKKVPPDYPAIAKQLNLTGSVEVETTIDENGDVSEVTPVSGNPVLAKAATDAIKKWKFKPFKSKVVSNFIVGFHGS